MQFIATLYDFIKDQCKLLPHCTIDQAQMQICATLTDSVGSNENGCHPMGWLRLVGSIKSQVSFAKEPYKRNCILQKRPIILSILLTIATPYTIQEDRIEIVATLYSHFSQKSH